MPPQQQKNLDLVCLIVSATKYWYSNMSGSEQLLCMASSMPIVWEHVN